MIAFLSAPSHEARAWPPTFGAEFTFSNPDLATKDFGPNRKAREVMMDRIREYCRVALCNVKEGVDAYLVTYGDGWWFNVSVDPGVIEVQTKASTLEELEGVRPRLNAVFEIAQQSGVYPHPILGGGHINIGAVSAFGLGGLGESPENLRLFRDFFVDFANHPELAEGILDEDYFNGPVLNALGEDQRAAFVKLLKDVDEGKVTTIADFTRRLQKEVYFRTVHEKWGPPQKYQALNVKRIPDDSFDDEVKTLEIRPVRAQKNADEFIREARLFQKRLEYLKSLSKPVPYVFKRFKWSEKRQALRHFYQYVQEAGLDPEDYRSVLDDKWKAVDPGPTLVERVKGFLGLGPQDCAARFSRLPSP